MSEVVCNHCGKRYNLGNVETVHRYADCTMFKTPCCNRTVDDRRWKSLPDFEYVRDLPEWDPRYTGQPYVDKWGRLRGVPDGD